MLQGRNWKLLSLLLIAACLTGAAFAGEDQDKDKDVEVIVDEKVKVIVKKLGDCEGEDCEQRRMIFIGEDGESHEIEGDHGDHVWIGRHGSHQVHHGAKGGFLGVQMTELTPELRSHFGVPDDAGVMVSKVVDDSPASRAGVAVGDIISAVDGEAVGSGRALAGAIRGHEDGAAVNLEIWRDGQVQTLTATVEERQGMRHARAMRLHKHAGHDFDCGGEGKCEVRVECDGSGDCECTVNGEAADCDEIHGAQGGE